MSSRIPALIINLPKDEDRLELVLKQFEALSDFRAEIVVGCNGNVLADVASLQLTKDRDWTSRKGTLGCFLSHVLAWEKVSTSSAPFSLVLEDDVDVSRLSRLTDVPVPADADIIFLNDRLSPKLTDEPLRLLPIAAALEEMERSRNGPGGDGYLLTPVGARKLLAACEEDLFYGHVDGRLLRYATTVEDLLALPGTSWIRTVVERHHHPSLKPKLGILRSYVTSSALVRHRGVSSSREREDAASQARQPTSTDTQGSTPVAAAGSGLSDLIPIRYWFRIRNIGDVINPYIVENASGLNSVYENDASKEHLLGIGSILFMANTHSHVWGSGILDPSHDIPPLDGEKIYALRGKLTRDLLAKKLGRDLDVPLGDPGYLVSELPQVRSAVASGNITRKAVLIPHYAVEDHPSFKELAHQVDAEIISARTDSLDFVTKIAQSELIISQSLHGLIFAAAFNKPIVWISQTEDPSWTFKFLDWFSTTDTPEPRPFIVGGSAARLKELVFQTTSLIDKEELKACLPRIRIGGRPLIGFEETRRAAPLVVRVNSASSSTSDADHLVECEPGNTPELRGKLSAIFSKYAEPVPAFVIFEPDFAEDLLEAKQDLMNILTNSPNSHYFVINDPSWSGEADFQIVGANAAKEIKVVKAREGWPKAIFVRHLQHFAFEAPGASLLI